MAAVRRDKRPDVVHTDEETELVSFRRHKPEYSDMCPVCGPKVKERISKVKAEVEKVQRCIAIHKALVEFGYSSLTLQAVGESYDRAMSGHMMEAEIIDKLVANQLDQVGLLPAGAHRD